ncbi:MAG: FHA domain-containing protein [Pseudonocardiaceae bacterium]
MHVRLLPAGAGSLAGGVADGPPRTIYVQSAKGGISATLSSDFTVIFGRNEPDVHVCVGENDPYVSRQHGSVRRDGGGWTLRNDGRQPILFPGPNLLLNGHEKPLAEGYTPLFIRTSPRHCHLIEVLVIPSAAQPESRVRHDDVTEHRHLHLDDTERLVMVVLSQRYLRHESHPQPLSWNQLAEQLNEIEGGDAWTRKRAEKAVEQVRLRASRTGVPGLTRDEVGEPVGNALNHNLITALLLSATLVPPDLRAIGEAVDW